MEEEYAKDPENFDPDSINAVKTSLMGPLSGIGDSLFQGTIRVIAFGLGVQLAQQVPSWARSWPCSSPSSPLC